MRENAEILAALVLIVPMGLYIGYLQVKIESLKGQLRRSDSRTEGERNVE